MAMEGREGPSAQRLVYMCVGKSSRVSTRTPSASSRFNPLAWSSRSTIHGRQRLPLPAHRSDSVPVEWRGRAHPLECTRYRERWPMSRKPNPEKGECMIGNLHRKTTGASLSVALAILGISVILHGCPGGEETTTPPTRDATPSDLQNSAFEFPDGAIFDPMLAGKVVTLSIGDFGGTTRAPFVLEAPDVGGTTDGNPTEARGDAVVGTVTLKVDQTNQPGFTQSGQGTTTTYAATIDTSTGALTLQAGGKSGSSKPPKPPKPPLANILCCWVCSMGEVLFCNSQTGSSTKSCSGTEGAGPFFPPVNCKATCKCKTGSLGTGG